MDNTILESGQISVTLASGVTIEASVFLVAISQRGEDAVSEKRVVVEYESGDRELRSKKTRGEVYAHLVSVAEEYGVRRTDVVACRLASERCQLSSFFRSAPLADD